MNRRDGGFVLALVVILVVLAGVVAAPSFAPAATPPPSPTPTPAVGHVQGVLGRPSSVTPLTARTQVDRDLVALLFRGLVRLGPGSTVIPDLATRWSADEGGTRWTFHMRPDAWWHDGTPVTSADVVYTIRALQDPDYTGALAATWAQVTARALDAHTVQFDLGDPVGGFLQAAALPLMPAHILEGVPVAALADDAFASQPFGNGAFALVELTEDAAILEPVLSPVADPSGPLGDPAVGEMMGRTPRLASLELRFFDTVAALSAAFAAGDIGSVADLPPADAVALADSTPGAGAIRYPSTTLTAITFNLRTPGGPFADARSRRALLAAVDRSDMIADLLHGAAVRADTPIPPSSWAYDAKSAPVVTYDRSAAARGLREAGWRRPAKAWIPPRASKPLKVALLAPERAANPSRSPPRRGSPRRGLPWAWRPASRRCPPASSSTGFGQAIRGGRRRRQHGPGPGSVPNPGFHAGPRGRRERERHPGPGTGRGPCRGQGAGRDASAPEGVCEAPGGAHATPADAHALLSRQRPRGRPRARRAGGPARPRWEWAVLGRDTMDIDRTVTLAARDSGRCRGGGTGRRASLRS